MRRQNPAITALLLALILTTLALGACGGSSPAAAPPAEIASPTTPPTAEPTATPQPTATATATAEPTATPPPTETPSPTPTPRTITLAVAPELEAETAAALAESDDASYIWRLSVEDDPAALLAEGRADLAVGNIEGTVVREEPLAFMVPFTTNWEQIGTADAEAILANGHNLIQVVPWSAMTPDNKALRVNGLHPTDPDYPYRERWSLAAAPGNEEAAAALAPLLLEALHHCPPFVSPRSVTSTTTAPPPTSSRPPAIWPIPSPASNTSSKRPTTPLPIWRRPWATWANRRPSAIRFVPRRKQPSRWPSAASISCRWPTTTLRIMDPKRCYRASTCSTPPAWRRSAAVQTRRPPTHPTSPRSTA